MLAVPLVNAKLQFVGVLVGSVDFDRLGLRLQKLSRDAQGEYIALVDSQGYFLIYPDPSFLGTLAPKGDPLWKGLGGTKGTTMWYGGVSGEEKIVSYHPVGANGWALAVKAPISSIVQVTLQANILLFAIITIVAIFAAGILLVIQAKDPNAKQALGIDSS